MTHILLLLLCLLSSGLFLSILARQLRMFKDFKEGDKSKAFSICKGEEMNLVTLYDEDDAKFATSFTNLKNVNVWVGLQRIKSENKYLPECRALVNENITHLNCSNKMYFMCQQNFTVVKRTLNWCLAKLYCQDHNLGDLVSDDDKTMKEIMKKDKDNHFWIGGKMIDDWTWNDSSCSVFRDWKAPPKGDAEEKGAYVMERKLTSYGDKQTSLILCSKGDVRIVVIDHITATWEDALNYCDTHHSGLLQIWTQSDQIAVEKWLNGTGHSGTFWVGLRQSYVFGFWIWKDRMVGYSHWENGKHPEMPLSHQCGVIKSPGYNWTDYNCLHPLPFICEEVIVWLDKPS